LTVRHVSIRAAARLSGLSRRTLENWLSGRTLRPRGWYPLIQVAHSLRLTATETDRLLRAAGKPSLATLQASAAQSDGDPDGLLSYWQDDQVSSGDSMQRTALARLASMPVDHVPGAGLLPSGSRIPFAHNPCFVGRAQELQTIAKALRQQNGAAVISAIGGMGKTQLVGEFVHRYGRFFAGGVFWISFADPAAVDTEIAACVGALPKAQREAVRALKAPERVQRVREAWQEPMPRLLVFDNLDDRQAERLLQHYRPPTGGCRLLITSRRATWNRTLGLTRLRLDILSPTESRRLLQVLAPRLGDAEADQTAEAVGHYPLALHLAGSYLDTSPHLQVAVFVKRLMAQQLRHQTFTGDVVQVSPTLHDLSVEATFAISWRRLREPDSVDWAARTLMHSVSQFVPGVAVPIELLWQTVRERAGWAQHSGEVTWTDAVRRAVNLGLLSRDGDTITVHPVVAAFIERVAGAQVVAAAQMAIERSLIELLQEEGDTVSSVALRAVVAHLDHVARRALERMDDQAARLAHLLGAHLRALGDYGRAFTFSEKALALRRQLLPDDHADLADSLYSLAKLQELTDTARHGLPLYEEALAIRLRVSGEAHPETLRVMHTLGWVLSLHHQNKAEGLPLMEKALAMRRRVLGEDHLDVARSLMELGSTGPDLQRRMKLQEEALDILQRTLGDEHPETNVALARCSSNAYHIVGDVRRSLAMLRQALDHFIERLGDHPYTATAMSDIGHRYLALGRIDEAEAHCKAAHEMCQRQWGTHHFTFMDSLRGMANVHRARGRFDLALPLQQRSTALRREVTGPEHGDTIVEIRNLGDLYREMGDYDQALSLLTEAYEIGVRNYGAKSRSAADSLHCLGELNKAMGNDETARGMLETALALRRELLGEAHPFTAATLKALGALHLDSGRSDQARPLLEEALAIYQRRLGHNHAQTKAILTLLHALPSAR